VGLEPTKTGFAGQRLDHFGIATLENLYLNSIPKSVPDRPPCPLFTPILASLTLKPRLTFQNSGFCRPLPYHLCLRFTSFRANLLQKAAGDALKRVPCISRINPAHSNPCASVRPRLENPRPSGL
jgi:hypothetical protein